MAPYHGDFMDISPEDFFWCLRMWNHPRMQWIQHFEWLVLKEWTGVQVKNKTIQMGQWIDQHTQDRFFWKDIGAGEQAVIYFKNRNEGLRFKLQFPEG